MAGTTTQFVKRIRDIMRNDPGINGDAQRIEQLSWILFLKVYDDRFGRLIKMIMNQLFRKGCTGVNGLKTIKMVKL